MKEDRYECALHSAQNLIIPQESPALTLQRLLQVSTHCTPGPLLIIIKDAASADTVMEQIFYVFNDTVKKERSVSEDLRRCQEIATQHRALIRNARESGKTCRKQAVWVGLER
jgi:hypothetical protein